MSGTEKTAFKDNGILDFMTPDRAIELYKRIAVSGPPELEWRFHGRRKPATNFPPGEAEIGDKKEATEAKDEVQNTDNSQDQAQDDFDFDEEFSANVTLTNESLQLKRRSEPGSEKKTNLSDIMSDIMKESHTGTEAGDS